MIYYIWLHGPVVTLTHRADHLCQSCFKKFQEVPKNNIANETIPPPIPKMANVWFRLNPKPWCYMVSIFSGLVVKE